MYYIKIRLFSYGITYVLVILFGSVYFKTPFCQAYFIYYHPSIFNINIQAIETL